MVRSSGAEHTRWWQPRAKARATRWLLLLAIGGCGGPPAERSTGVLVVLEADAEARSRLALLRVEVRGVGPDGSPAEARTEALRIEGPFDWPRRFAVEPMGGDARRQFTVTVEGFEDGDAEQPLVVLRVRSGFVTGSWRQLSLLLASSCFGVRCGEGESCEQGSCLPDYKAPESLPPAVDEERGGCLDDEACEDGDPCTADWCLQGSCVHGRPAPGRLAFRDVVASSRHTCAIDAMGRPWCWGARGSGRLGIGAVADGDCGTGAVVEPVAVAGLPEGVRLRQIALGRGHSCAVDRLGGLWCWGDDRVGQAARQRGTNALCEATLLAPRRPERVWRAVGAGAPHTCALDAEGAVVCWGWGHFGVLGEMRRNGVVDPVPGLGPAGLLAVGPLHGCAAERGGAVRCWGINLAGQLGVEEPEQSAEPLAVPGLPPVRALAAGATASCALAEDGAPWCWGENGAGQLGRGSPTPASLPPGPVQGLGPVRQVALGAAHACAVDEDGAAWCWGAGDAGQLGLGDRLDRASPERLEGIGSSVVRVAAGTGHGCAVDVTGALWCWGAGDAGQLGVGDTAPRLRPARVGEGLRCP